MVSLKDDMYDLTGAGNVELSISADGRVVWVNVDGTCRFRICRIAGDITIDDSRPKRRRGR